MEQNSGLLTSLQQTDARIQTEIDAVETFYRAISSANAMLSDASSKADESLREVQNLAWNLDSRYFVFFINQLFIAYLIRN